MNGVLYSQPYVVRSHGLWPSHRPPRARVQGDRVLQARRTRTAIVIEAVAVGVRTFVYALHSIQIVTRTYYYTRCGTRSETKKK
jgi:hypothetical protein